MASAGWLFQQDTAASVPAAVQLVPFNSAYLARLAAWKPNEKVALLHRAVMLNPFDSESWIQLGFVSEFQQHDEARAEKYFLRAAEVNKMFLPKWTLTNFYFRHGNITNFFHWASATLAITPYSPEPVFTQMWLMSQDAERIARAVPDRPRTLLPYAWFLSNAHQYGSIVSVIERLIKSVGNKDPRAWGRDDLLANIEDRMVLQGDRDLALSIWASMVRGGWLQQNISDAGHPLTNGDFRTPFFRHGLDWIPASVDGIKVEQSPSEGVTRLYFSGNEPEHCVILQQYLPLEAGGMYQFQWQAETRLNESPAGLTWHLGGADRPAEYGVISPDLSMASRWRVQAPAGTGFALLSLEYNRPLGHLRARGFVTLRSISAARESRAAFSETPTLGN